MCPYAYAYVELLNVTLGNMAARIRRRVHLHENVQRRPWDIVPLVYEGVDAVDVGKSCSG